MYNIVVRISKQRLYLNKGKTLYKQYPVSTSKYGVGNKQGSNKTPLGLHMIVSKIGRNAKVGEILRSRKRTRNVAKRKTGKQKEQDLITSRILRLTGLETGVNKGTDIDSYTRCIYIHGTSQEHLIGHPASHGCIRMKNRDIIELFDLVPHKALVEIRR